MKVSPRTADRLSGWAQEFYNPALPYHNWGHAEEVMAESAQLLNTNGRWTRHVNRPLVQVAAAWHDAGHDYDERHEFESPEHYSVHLMRDRLKGQLVPRQLDEIEESILGTRFGVVCDTMSSIALHYGDVGNMAHEFPSFQDHTVRLWEEHGEPEWEDFVANARQVIVSTAFHAGRELPRIGMPGEQYQSAIIQNLYKLIAMEGPKG